MQTSSLRRQMKNMVNNYTEAEIKVREATSNDPWGPPSSLMCEIADLTFNAVAFAEVMGMIWKRLNDHGKNWRHVYKALTLLDYLIKSGSERVARECRENVYSIQTLRDFQYIDRDGRDQGINVREKAKHLVALLRDEEKLKRERSQALKTKTRMTGAHSSMGSGSLPPPYPGGRSTPRYHGDEAGTCRGSPTGYYSSSSSPQVAPDLEQARPATSEEEELQLQLALAKSREESEKPPPTVEIDEQTQLQIALNLSKEEAKKGCVPQTQTARREPANTDMDEDSQLQLALNLSKEEHKQEQLSREGEEKMLQKALEESKREMDSKGGTAFMDLVDVFAVPAEQPPSEPRWVGQNQAAAHLGVTDPWDSLEGSTTISRADPPWMTQPISSSPPPPWEPPADPWDGAGSNLSNLAAAEWPAADTIDPFSVPANRPEPKGPSARPGSPTDGDLFDEAMDGGQVNVNGRGDSSPEPFELSALVEGLPAPSPRKCRTPESFLDPNAASLVNLETLIPSNPSSKTTNPFLAGLSAPPANNPFQSEASKLTLNQLSVASSSPQPSSLPYSASLPLPAGNQPSSLPSSLTHPTQPGLGLLGTLPEPLLPLSSASADGSQSLQSNQNPFL